MKAVSLFSGAGGMDVGFAKAGVTTVWANEMDPDAAETYRRNHPGVTLRQGDIKSAKTELGRSFGGGVDLVFGGPPCQGFSVAGKMDPDDKRSALIWEFLDVVDMLRPSAFVMENVKALGVLRRWEHVRERIVTRAAEIGYLCFPVVLNAADFGVPQKRERVFFLGFHNQTANQRAAFHSEIAKQMKPRTTLRECLSQLPPLGAPGNPATCLAKITVAASPVMRRSPYAGMLFNGLGRPLDLDNQANTLPASMGGNKTPIIDQALLSAPDSDDWDRHYHAALSKGGDTAQFGAVPRHLRRITTAEAAAIQTFPQDYEFFGGKSSVYRQIGNAVPCGLAAVVAVAVLNVLKHSHSKSRSA
jgi:DNA (cytosine-5)-methyltransferase 1